MINCVEYSRWKEWKFLEKVVNGGRSEAREDKERKKGVGKTFIVCASLRWCIWILYGRAVALECGNLLQ